MTCQSVLHPLPYYIKEYQSAVDAVSNLRAYFTFYNHEHLITICLMHEWRSKGADSVIIDALFGTDASSRIGGWRGTALAALFPPRTWRTDCTSFQVVGSPQFPLLSLGPLRIARRRIRFERFPCHPWPYDWLSQPFWQVETPATTTVTPSP